MMIDNMLLQFCSFFFLNMIDRQSFCQILEWLRTQHWWDFKEMDFLMLITAYGKLGDFGQAESILSVMNKQGCPPTVGSHTALMEAYGRAGQYSKAESIFRRMQLSGPEPSALTYQIILKTLVEVVHLLSFLQLLTNSLSYSLSSILFMKFILLFCIRAISSMWPNPYSVIF